MGWGLPLEVQKAFRKEIMNIHKIMDFYVFILVALVTSKAGSRNQQFWSFLHFDKTSAF